MLACKIKFLKSEKKNKNKREEKSKRIFSFKKENNKKNFLSSWFQLEADSFFLKGFLRANVLNRISKNHKILACFQIFYFLFSNSQTPPAGEEISFIRRIKSNNIKFQ